MNTLLHNLSSALSSVLYLTSLASNMLKKGKITKKHTFMPFREEEWSSVAISLNEWLVRCASLVFPPPCPTNVYLPFVYLQMEVVKTGRGCHRCNHACSWLSQQDLFVASHMCVSPGERGKYKEGTFPTLALWTLKVTMYPPSTTLTADLCTDENMKPKRMAFLLQQISNHILTWKINSCLLKKCFMCLEPKHSSKQYHVVRNKRNQGWFCNWVLLC